MLTKSMYHVFQHGVLYSQEVSWHDTNKFKKKNSTPKDSAFNNQSMLFSSKEAIICSHTF